ncbi:MAG: methyltransferase domain-containing protein [Candidatus Obscuribacter sp.]|jgi:2-polyprenyl-3-methyl-5-hydroxy-6-metoxy-1,4-benzoquinol methylase|nr:methyltransferase domain-containing protein [Candidatus Obscuribacter sp.]MDQ5964713.1 Methyltransferase protein [Cyanobacteriota bacterium erpe_2018_sw_39hr_WHONDRS-SW48-000098_B_bin.30]MBK7841022.1 methyltransferase domain-containing protein [Candidatus Obscuribacter sp.]MBK9774197.1 methyltransferase domain-containing protein [Candidatus Obscuribacter sp.]MBL0189381.1 methyltransferase domain-containing protein [Candidatus Obscuribacter sp.]
MLARTRVDELMDDPGLDYASHVKALQGLERLNSFSTSAEILWQQIKPFARSAESKKLSVLDIATGGGDIPVALYRLAKKDKVRLDITAGDISDTAIDYSTAYAKLYNIPIKVIRLDALNDPLPGGFDVVITSLFTHHLEPDQVVSLMAKMRESTRGIVLINDLVRSDISLAAVWLATRLLSTSPIVQFDGPASVRGSYTPAEMRKMAEQAGLNDCQIKMHPPCRQLLMWRRSFR